MRIVTLMEDTACAPEFACEHGLSFYIEANSQKLLFDMGQTDLFLRNAQALGVSRIFHASRRASGRSVWMPRLRTAAG